MTSPKQEEPINSRFIHSTFLMPSANASMANMRIIAVSTTTKAVLLRVLSFIILIFVSEQLFYD